MGGGSGFGLCIRFHGADSNFCAAVSHWQLCGWIGSCVCDLIIAAEEQFTAMLVSGDPKAVEVHLAGDAVWTLGDGRRWTKPEAISAIRNGPRMARSELVRADVRVFGDVAVVQWMETWTMKGEPGASGSTLGTDTWSKRSGRWQIIASQEARPPH